METYDFKPGDIVIIDEKHLFNRSDLRGVPLRILGFDDDRLQRNTIAHLHSTINGVKETARYLYKLHKVEISDNESALEIVGRKEL